jgi:hypothetical protein
LPPTLILSRSITRGIQLPLTLMSLYELNQALRIAEAQHKALKNDAIMREDKLTPTWPHGDIREYRNEAPTPLVVNRSSYVLTLECANCPATIQVVGNDLGQCCTQIVGWTRPYIDRALCPACSSEKGSLK